MQKPAREIQVLVFVKMGMSGNWLKVGGLSWKNPIMETCLTVNCWLYVWRNTIVLYHTTSIFHYYT